MNMSQTSPLKQQWLQLRNTNPASVKSGNRCPPRTLQKGRFRIKDILQMHQNLTTLTVLWSSFFSRQLMLLANGMQYWNRFLSGEGLTQSRSGVCPFRQSIQLGYQTHRDMLFVIRGLGILIQVMKTDQEIVFQSAKEACQKLSLPEEISTMLKGFQVSIVGKDNLPKGYNGATTEPNPNVVTVFQKLKKGEKIRHYAFCIHFLSSATQCNPYQFTPKVYQRSVAHVNAYQKSGLFGLSEKTLVIIDFRKRSLVLGAAGKKQVNIALTNYLLRESHDPKKYCLIFNSIAKQPTRPTLRLHFDEYIYREARNTFQNLMEEVYKERLYNQLGKHRKSLQVSSVGPSVPAELDANFLKQGNLALFKSLLETLRQNDDQEVVTGRLDLFTSSYKTIKTNGNTYYLQELFFLSKEELMLAVSAKNHKWNSMCQDSILIESNGNEMVFCQKYLHNDVVYSTTYMTSAKKEMNKGRAVMMSVRNDCLVADRSLKIEFVSIKALKIEDEVTQLNVKVKMNTMDANRESFTIEYLKQFSNLYSVVSAHKEKRAEAKLFKRLSHQTEETIYFDAQGQEDFQLQNMLDDIPQDIQTMLDLNQEVCSTGTSRISSLTGSYNFENQVEIEKQLQYLHSVHPQLASKTQPLQIMKTHYLDAEWVRNKNGGLLCINQRVLGEHKKVLKHIVTSFGKNLLHNKGIMNISFPVTICTKISHLQMIANNFIYAPLLVESHCNSPPVQRMKNLVVFLMTIGNTGISSEKPFNPILGQTYQGLINGCPIYLQQISHHPPESAYLMEGRGYKVMGSIEPKVEPTGINSVRCYSEKHNRIQFQDGSVVYMSIPKINIKGLIFGSREFCFQGKSFMFDTKNLLFADISYGAKKNSFLGGSKDPVDLVYGKILKVTPEFMQVFTAEGYKTFPSKEYVNKQLSQFEGTWTQSIRFDGAEFFNFRTQLPCLLEPYSQPLPSDSTFRTDIQKLCENDIKEAQIQKEKWEDLQRRDKALREKFKKKVSG